MIKENIVVIPSYEPEPLLINLVEQLKEIFIHIIIVNDGSNNIYKNIFDELKNISGVMVLEHNENKGKGAALKTAFRYVLEYFPHIDNVIMCDADGQHLPEDVAHVAEIAKENPSVFIFGTRHFTRQNTPFRSWFGNKLTQFILKLFLRTPLTDTQTGLRSYPTQYLKYFIEIPYDRYEYDTESILIMSQNSWKIKTIPIQTVYIEGNRSSHFNPIKDSLKIYWIILRFSIVSLISFVIDISIFSMMTFLSFSTFISLLSSKSISAIFNFLGHRSLTFSANNPMLKSFLKYLMLWVFNLFLGTYLIDSILMYTSYHKVTIKIFVDVILFIINFLISKFIIFKSTIKD